MYQVKHYDLKEELRKAWDKRDRDREETSEWGRQWGFSTPRKFQVRRFWFSYFKAELDIQGVVWNVQIFNRGGNTIETYSNKTDKAKRTK